jgi:hypothetical protein
MDKNVHLISKTGEKIVVPHKDYNDSEMLKDGKYDDYEVDINLYLNNGYMTLEDMRKSIEGTALNDFDDQLRLDEMKEWSAEEQTRYLCPNGVMTIEEFRALGHKMIDEFYDEQNEEE